METIPIVPSSVEQVYRYLLVSFARTGQPPALEKIARELDLPRQIVGDALDALERGGSIYRDRHTRALLATYPFSATPTQHIVQFADGHTVYAMCAIDALGMPVMLAVDAIIASRCAHCGKEIRVAVKQNALAEYAPRAARVWHMQIDPCCVPALEQCPRINFFCSAEHLAARHAEHPTGRGGALTMDEAFERGVAEFGNLLKSLAVGNGI